jgi:hypothetical protein
LLLLLLNKFVVAAEQVAAVAAHQICYCGPKQISQVMNKFVATA